LDPKTFGQYDKYKDSQGVQFYDLQTGTGKAIAAGSQVAVLYRGWLTDGTLFDESRTGSDGKIQAFGFVEGQHQVIPGWEAGLEGVKSGGVRLLIIPPAFGYGATGQGPIPGNAVLVFQVQVVQVQ
jgi:FKBP-type peptidyl-prolyl cis-trans isomerase